MFDIKFNKLIELCKLILDSYFLERSNIGYCSVSEFDINETILIRFRTDILPVTKLFNDYYLNLGRRNYFQQGIVIDEFYILNKMVQTIPFFPINRSEDYDNLGDIEFQLLTIHSINEVRSMILEHIINNYVGTNYSCDRKTYDYILDINFLLYDSLDEIDIQDLCNTVMEKRRI